MVVHWDIWLPTKLPKNRSVISVTVMMEMEIGKDTNDILYAVSQSCGLYVVKGATGLLEVREG